MERVGQLAAAEDRGAFGDALAALIAVDAPALQVLVCRDNFLGDAGLAPIVEALPLNRHLRELDVSDNDMSEAFARERLLLTQRFASSTVATVRELLRMRWSWCAAGGSPTDAPRPTVLPSAPRGRGTIDRTTMMMC